MTEVPVFDVPNNQPWRFVSKQQAANFCGVDETFLPDEWSIFIENLIEAEYRHKIGAREYDEYYDGTGHSKLFLRNTPIVELREIYYFDYSTNFYVDASGYGELILNKRNYLTLKNDNVFPIGRNNIRIVYLAGEDFIDPRLAFSEMACIAYLVKFMIANRGDDSIKFSTAYSLGTNQYTHRPGVMTKVMDIIKESVPKRSNFL